MGYNFDSGQETMQNRLRKPAFGLLGVLIISLATDAAAQLDVRYEPSNPAVVTEMLTMAAVTERDVLYDLGCGDGRIVITAASLYGVRGIGIDLDPVRIAESNENARKAGVTGSVRFIEQNLFDAEIANATVVALFLWPSVNLKLRPKLFADLAPGTRIVSHEHDMGDWLPDRTSVVEDDYTSHVVYLWILPANVSGTWEWMESAIGGKRTYRLKIAQQYQRITGSLTGENGPIPVSEMMLSGDRLRIIVEEDTVSGKSVRLLDGIVTGNTISGNEMTKTPSGLRVRPWKIVRDPSTAVPLE